MSDVQVFTQSEVAAVVRDEFDRFRNEVRDQAHGAFGDARRQRRGALLEVLFNLDRFRDDVLSRFGVDVDRHESDGSRLVSPAVPTSDTAGRIRGNQGHHLDRRAS